MKTFLISLILISQINSALADLSATSPDAVFLEKGAQTPFSGFLISKDKALDMRNTSIQRDEYKLLNDSLTRSINYYQSNETLKDSKVNTLLDQNDKLAVALNDARSTTTWEKVAYFIGGAIITSAAFYGATKLVK